jgi:LmbE family N-acetylglucosaminyl deacetylase
MRGSVYLSAVMRPDRFLNHLQRQCFSLLCVILRPPRRTTMYRMSKSAAKVICCAIGGVIGIAAAVAIGVAPGWANSFDGTPEEAFLIGTPAIRYSLEKLNVLGSVLMIGAHPDDENNAVLTWMSRGLKARTGYLSLNRGEGGQNLLGDEQGPLMGVVRTQELLAARRDDGGSQYFTRAIDFGFTTSLDETLTDWGRDKILGDVVWVIRQQQPDVIIDVFSGTTADGHGNHQAAGVLGKEAYEEAGDPNRFPEQLKWVKPWKAHRLMRSRFTPPPGAAAPGAAAGGRGGRGGGRNGGGQPGAQAQGRGGGRADANPDQPTIPIDTGDFDPSMGRSYREISIISRSEHRSQGQGSQLAFGSSPGLLATVEGDVPKKSLFEGIDVTWNRLPGGARIGVILATVQSDFDDHHPEKSVAALLEARGLIAGLANDGQTWATWKLDDIDEAIALCAGLRTEVQADAPAYVPGATAKVQLTALNRSSLPITLKGIHLSGWADMDAPARDKVLANNQPEVETVSVPISAKQPWTQPFWMKEAHDLYTYTISDQTLIGRADTIPEVVARFDFAIGSAPFSITKPIHYRYGDPAKGEIIRPVVVEPPVAIDLPAENVVFPLGGPRDYSVQIRALTANQSGDVRLETPQGWKVSPTSAPFELKEAGSAQEVRFRLTPPAATLTGPFRVVAKANGVEVSTGVDVIAYSHIPAQTVLLPAGGKLAAVPLKVLARRVGYVMGSSDREPEALRQMGCQVDLLTEKDLSSGNLAAYDAIVAGIRAYALRPDLRANQQRLLEYVKNGGTLVVQYHNNADRRISPSVAEAFDHMGPYPFTIAGNDARVTQEDAPVKVLQPDSPLLNVPNKITQADFEGWIQERGLYFANTWDERYQTPLETHDKGDKDQPGALLYARYGKGAYIFTAFSWFRELPAGVPGAYRIFANLISAGKAGAGK